MLLKYVFIPARLQTFPFTENKVPSIKSSGSVVFQCQMEGICLYFIQTKHAKDRVAWREPSAMSDRKSTFWLLAFHVLLQPDAEGMSRRASHLLYWVTPKAPLSPLCRKVPGDCWPKNLVPWKCATSSPQPHLWHLVLPTLESCRPGTWQEKAISFQDWKSHPRLP